MKKIFIFVLSLVSIVPLGLYFIKFHFGLSNISSNWADFGSYVGGVYGAMAFFAVAYSIYITGVQFRKQHEDKIFYKSVDDLIDSIGRYEKLNGKEDIKSGSAISSIINEFYEELRKLSSHLARTLLCNNPTTIPETNLLNIVYGLPRNSIGYGVEITKNEFLKVLSEFKDFNECWEWLKGPLGGVYEENEPVKNALQAAGSVSFYKTSFDDRIHYCQLAWDTIEKRYDELINRYTKNMAFILAHVHNAKRKKVYLKYLMSRLTKYDIAFLFYFALISNDYDFLDKLIHYGITYEIKRVECRELLLDYPSEEQISYEIKFIKERVNKFLHRTPKNGRL